MSEILLAVLTDAVGALLVALVMFGVKRAVTAVRG